MDRLSHLFTTLPAHSKAFLFGTSIATTLAFLTAARLTLYTSPSKTVPSPLKTVLLKLSQEEQQNLPYPPDVFPGARDVDSPYGSIRVYEWGPEQGRKVLLLHGISTPCLALGSVANAFVERGCRILLMDLWGRGYSDAVDLPHDSRLYTTQILLAITSSPLAWTPEGFSLVGYSLGGGIAADFGSSFPHLVKAVVLLAPAGMIRSDHFGWQSRLMYTLLLPPAFVEWVVRRRLKTTQKTIAKETQTVEKAVNEEIRGTSGTNFDTVQLSKKRPGVTVASAVQWQLEYHEGFVAAFVSSIKHSSIERTQETVASWARLGKTEDKVIVMAGSSDPLIMPAELEIDAKKVIGAEKVEWRVIEGGHEFPITRGEEVVNEIPCTLALSSGTSVTSASALGETNKSFTTEDFLNTSSDIVPFNDRSIETRDARLANALDSLDEDLPIDVQNSIKDLRKTHAKSTSTALGHMEFLADENYLEYKNNLAAKRSLGKKLPRSKGRGTSPN